MKIQWQELGLLPYKEAYELQEKLRLQRINGEIVDRFLMLEHRAVFTTGKRDCGGDFRSDLATIASDGIEVVRSNRGGRVTYHGPGQLIGYFIFNISEGNIGVKEFVNKIEEMLIDTLMNFGIVAQRDPAHPGLWIGDKKIAAIGLNIERNVSIHGFALNVTCDLSAYRHIIACGIRDRGVTSMATLLGCSCPTMADVKAAALKSMTNVFAREVEEINN